MLGAAHSAGCELGWARGAVSFSIHKAGTLLPKGQCCTLRPTRPGPCSTLGAGACGEGQPVAPDLTHLGRAGAHRQGGRAWEWA